MDMKLILCLIFMIGIDLVMFFVSDVLNMRNTSAQKTFIMILAAVINVLLIRSWCWR